MKRFDELALERKWTVLLKALPEEETTIVQFPDPDSMKCLKSIAYCPYGDLKLYEFSIKRESELTLSITKKRV